MTDDRTYSTQMAAVVDHHRVPPLVRPILREALANPHRLAEAIGALEMHLGPERPPELLVLLAVLVYRDALLVMRHQLGSASRRALALIDEALAKGHPLDDHLRELRELLTATERGDRVWEEQVLAMVEVDARRVPTVDLIGLAHRLASRGGDPKMVERLYQLAEERSEPPSLRLVLPDE